ncbi:MAG: hypothetical protein ABWY63_14390 [Hyphomicrobiaceae bacterium]
MRPAGPNHSNVLLVMVIASVVGLCLYALTLHLGGWKALIALFGVSLLVWCLLIISDHWPPR